MGQPLGFQFDPDSLGNAERRTRQALEESVAQLDRVYGDPQQAREALRIAIRERGSDLTFAQHLAERPEVFGQLRGGLLDRRQSRQQTTAWAEKLGRSSHRRLETLAAIEKARPITLRIASLREQLPDARQHGREVQALAQQLSVRSIAPAPIQAALRQRTAASSKVAERFARRVGMSLLYSTAGRAPVVGTLLHAGRLLQRLPRLARFLTQQHDRSRGR